MINPNAIPVLYSKVAGRRAEKPAMMKIYILNISYIEQNLLVS